MENEKLITIIKDEINSLNIITDMNVLYDNYLDLKDNILKLFLINQERIIKNGKNN